MSRSLTAREAQPGALRCGDVPLPDLAERFGTPLYAYDIRMMEARFDDVRRAFSGVDTLIAFSVKANGNLAVLRRLGALGAGADIVSEGELFRALRAGIPPERIVFAGVGKSRAEMRAALDAGIRVFNVESAPELRRLDEVATGRGLRAPVAVRVNPDVTAPTPHEYTRTGHAHSKFGIAPDEAAELLLECVDRPGLSPVGLDLHIGSQIADPEPYERAVECALSLLEPLRRGGVDPEFLDIGGGFGVRYGDEAGLALEDLAARIVPRLRGQGLDLIVEPGRFIAGEAGVLLTRVEYVKRAGGKVFVIVDGGMSELIRPSHYGGYHRIERVDAGDRPVESVDVVGPLCENGDFLARDRRMPVPDEGELLVVHTAGAYGFTMASNYNARRRPAEVLVDGARAHLVRRRESLEDLVRGELIPEDA